MSGRNGMLFGSLTVSWLGTAANWASEAKSILGALAALASLVASCYAVAAARKKLRGRDTEATEVSDTESTEAVAARAKIKRKDRKGSAKGRRRIVAAMVMLLTLFLSGGCTHVGKKMERTRAHFEKNEEVLREESRALTTGVVDALVMAPKSPETELAKSLALADQEVEGLPLKRLPVTEALAGDTSAALVIDERVKAIEALRVENAQLRERVRATEERVIELGVKAEEERNARIKFWSKWLSAGTLLIGGGVALFVFCPVALPIVGRMLGWAVGKIPALAGALGVVGKDAFDAVVRGVGTARAQLKQKESGDLETFDNHLRIETDVEHKRLIEARRVAVGV